MVRWQGLIRIIKPGVYKISLETDSEARLFINEELAMQNNGTTLVGDYFREEVELDLPSDAVYFELHYKHLYTSPLVASGTNDRNGLILTYKGRDDV